MSKRIISYLLCLCLLFAVSGCAKAERLTVTATFYPLYVAAINVARGVEGVTVSCLTPPAAGCLHDYQMTAADRRLLSDSGIIIQNGAGLEGFLDGILPNLSATVVDASEGIALLPGHEGEENPHVWVSVRGMMAQVENIGRGLAKADPIHAAQYAENTANYLGRLAALEIEMKETLSPLAGAAIVTFHEAFDYFAEDFGLRVAAVVEAEPGSAPSARELAEVAALVEKENVRALFAEPQYQDVSIAILSRETGVPVYILDPFVSGEADPSDYDAYLRVMRENMRVLREALP